MMQSKIAYGKRENIEAAVAEKKVDTGDIIFTSDSEEFAFIKPDGKIMYPKNKGLIFESMEEAEAYVDSNPNSIYAGQSILIKEDDGKYNTYMVQLVNESGEENFVIESGGSTVAIEKAKQEAITESKNYIDSALTIVEF